MTRYVLAAILVMLAGTHNVTGARAAALFPLNVYDTRTPAPDNAAIRYAEWKKMFESAGLKINFVKLVVGVDTAVSALNGRKIDISFAAPVHMRATLMEGNCQTLIGVAERSWAGAVLLFHGPDKPGGTRPTVEDVKDALRKTPDFVFWVSGNLSITHAMLKTYLETTGLWAFIRDELKIDPDTRIKKPKPALDRAMIVGTDKNAIIVALTPPYSLYAQEASGISVLMRSTDRVSPPSGGVTVLCEELYAQPGVACPDELNPATTPKRCALVRFVKVLREAIAEMKKESNRADVMKFIKEADLLLNLHTEVYKKKYYDHDFRSGAQPAEAKIMDGLYRSFVDGASVEPYTTSEIIAFTEFLGRKISEDEVCKVYNQVIFDAKGVATIKACPAAVAGLPKR